VFSTKEALKCELWVTVTAHSGGLAIGTNASRWIIGGIGPS